MRLELISQFLKPRTHGEILREMFLPDDTESGLISVAYIGQVALRSRPSCFGHSVVTFGFSEG
jgi:hypothetical protein